MRNSPNSAASRIPEFWANWPMLCKIVGQLVKIWANASITEALRERARGRQTDRQIGKEFDVP